MTVEATSPKRSGLAIVWDVIVAPASAFEALRERTHWGWAYSVVCVLGVAGALLQVPAGVHMVAATIAHSADPNFAAMSAEKQQQIVAQAQAIQRFSWLFFPVIAIVAISVAAALLLLGSTIAKGTGGFAQFFGLAANVAVINFGIGYLLIGALAALRGPEAFSTQRDMLAVLPSLAWLAPAASPKVTAFLSTFNPFQIWSFVLIAMGLGSIAKIARGPAFAIAAVVTFGGVLFAVPFAK